MLDLLRFLIYYPLLNLLMFFIWLTPGHYAAVGIILLTLLVRFVLLIPSKKAAQAQRRLQELQPLMEELKREYGDDKQGLAMAQMELYKKNNINPFSSCFLSLIQLPILYILYYAFLHGFNVNNPHLYSFVPRPDSINPFLLGIDLLQKPTGFPVIATVAAVFQYVQMRMTMTPSANPNDPSVAVQRNMMYLLPLMTFVIARNFQSGVALYWVVTTLFSVVQQYQVNQEKLKLVGVEKVKQDAERLHPEAQTGKKEEVSAPKEVSKTVAKKGVQVTVRRKK